MADVRSLLRQERAARQQSGRKSAAPATVPTSRKRKAADTGLDERKKTKTADGQAVASGLYGDEAEAVAQPPAQEPVQDDMPEPSTRQPEQAPLEATPADISPTAQQPADEDDLELDAFMKEIEEAPQPSRGVRDLYAGAVIEAAPMTAAEVAAQAREEQSAQRGKKEEELEAEKEDAAQQLQEEFDEMEELEERVRRLREKREALRTAHVKPAAEDIVLPDPEPAGEEDEESESEEEDWDDWRFRPA